MAFRIGQLSTALLLVWWFGQGTMPVLAQNPVPERSWATAGESIFIQNCAPCHGTSGSGDGPVMREQDKRAPSLIDPSQVALGSPADWLLITREGRIENLMPPWQNQLTEGQLGDVVAWIWHLSTSAADLTRGEEAWHQLSALLGPGDWQTLALTANFADWAQALSQQLVEQELPIPTDDELRLSQRHLQSLTLTPNWHEPIQPGSGSLTGLIQQRSPGTSPDFPSLVQVQAQIGETFLDAFEVPVAIDGTFVLPHIETVPRIQWTAIIEQSELVFRSDQVSFDQFGRAPDLTVDLYQPSTTQAQLEVESLQMVMSLSESRLYVGQTVSLINTLPWVFVGERESSDSLPITVRIPISPEAGEVTLADFGQRRFSTEGAFIQDSAPVYPVEGRHQATLGYILPWPLAEPRWQLNLPYPIREATLLISQSPGLVSNPQGFTQVGTRDLDGQLFNVWHAVDLSNGLLDLRFSGPAADPLVSASPHQREPAYVMPTWLPAIFGLILLGGGGFLLVFGLQREHPGQDA